MLLVPVRGTGGLFGTPKASEEDQRAMFEAFWKQFSPRKGPSGIPGAEIHVKGDIFKVHILQETWDKLHKGGSGQMVSLNFSKVTMALEDAPVVSMLHSYVCAPPM
jgi:hypothetical protein